MLKLFSVLISLAATLFCGGAALPQSHDGGKRWIDTEGSAQCTSFYQSIPFSVNNTDRQAVIGDPPATQMGVVQMVIDVVTTNNPLPGEIARAKPMHVEGNYSLYFTHCQPANGSSRGVFLTVHGLSESSKYWNAQFGNTSDNSFTEAATAAGWSVLLYDRLGCGASNTPDGTQIVQSPVHLDQLLSIAKMLRQGNMSDIDPYKTVIGIGHSYGSELLVGSALAAPTAFDAMVLSGYTANQTAYSTPLGPTAFSPTIASTAADRFAHFGNDYWTTSSAWADQFILFHYPDFTAEAIQAWEDDKSQFSIGDWNAQFGGSSSIPPKNYTNPLLVLTGQYDSLNCDGDCYVSPSPNLTQLDTVRMVFTGVPPDQLQTVVVNGSGHAVNYHTVAPQAYATVVDFAKTVLFG